MRTPVGSYSGSARAIVRIEPPEGDPLRATTPTWHDALNAGKESVVCDLKSADGLELARALLARADVVLEGFRPGVAARLGVGPDDARPDAVYCSITGFGVGRQARAARRATTSTISAGPARSPTRRPACRPCRSPTSRRARSAR